MKQVKNIFFGLCILCYFSACQQKMICPAYHSYFILDVEETRKTFSLFGEDSLPKKRWEVEKEKYGIAKNIPDKKKNEEMRIISMNSIYKKIEDPFEQFRRENVFVDSTMIMDSASVIAASRGDNDFQNIDQMIYLHHFGKFLPSKRNSTDQDIQEDLKEEEPLITEEEEEIPKKKKKRGLFGKKRNKQKQDDSDEEETSDSEEDQ